MSTPPDAFLDELIEDLYIEPEQFRKALEIEYSHRQDLRPELKDMMIAYILVEYSEREHRAWENVIQILRKSPERIVKDLCEVVDDFLKAKSSKAALLLYYICEYTKARPDLVPFVYLERWIGSPEQFDKFSFLSVAIMLSRTHPDLILDVSLVSLVFGRLSISESLGLRSHELWFNIGIAYFNVLLAVAESWFEHVGWNTEFSRCLTWVLKDLARVRPDQISSMIDILRKFDFEEKPSEPDGIFFRFGPSPSDIITELEEIRGG